jgi:hypothetical protein
MLVEGESKGRERETRSLGGQKIKEMLYALHAGVAWEGFCLPIASLITALQDICPKL